METTHLSLRAALAENRLEDFVHQAMAHGIEFSRGSEFERGLALLLVKQNLQRASRPPAGALGSADCPRYRWSTSGMRPSK
jgi:hypothetical protein